MKKDLRQIGATKTNAPVSVDVGKFLEGRLLIASTSGGGKSTSARTFLESTHGACPQIIIDPEGEFESLRTKFDGYVLAAAKGGDVLLNAQTAGLLAMKTMELDISIILDLFLLDHTERHLVVKRYIDGLLSAPKELWRPRIVLLDEAHRYCPEKGKGTSVATGSVITLMDSGRKRGFGTALATQRLSKLAKDAAAECWNKMIGPTAWNDDRIRAAEEMGLSRNEKSMFRDLEPGEFVLAGRAFSAGGKPILDATKVMIAMPATRPAQAGKHRSRRPAPSSKVKAALAKLGDLPKEAIIEARTIEEFKVRVRQLEADLRQAKGPAVITIDKLTEVQRKSLEASFLKNAHLQPILTQHFPSPEKMRATAEMIARTEMVKVKNEILKEVGILENSYRTTADEAGHFIKDKTTAFEKRIGELCKIKVDPLPKPTDSTMVKIKVGQYIKFSDKLTNTGPPIQNATPTDGALPKPQERILSFLLLHEDGRQFTNKQVGVMVGMSGTSGTFNNHLSALSTRGVIARMPGCCMLKDRQMALSLTGGGEPIDSREAKQAWLAKLGEGPAKVYRELMKEPDRTFTNLEMAELVGSKVSNGNTSGTFNNWLSELSTLGLALRGKGTVQLDPAVKDL